MTDAPERIWACMGGPMVGLFVSGGNNGGWPEYVRADIAQALTAERDEAINQLDSSRHSVEVLEKRVAKFMADNARLTAALTDAGPYLERGLDKMAFNIIRAALKGDSHE